MRQGDPGSVRWEPDPVPVLRRWQDSGALWQVVLADSASSVLALMTCDGGEEVGRFRCATSAVTGFLAGRTRSDQELP